MAKSYSQTYKLKHVEYYLRHCIFMQLPLISLIIPVYNSDRTLEQCLESIKKQSYSNIEIIIIIDGATDNSLQIARFFCANDNRFLLHYQPNQGSGIARNAGIALAHGAFIAFIDPDDYVSTDYIETLYLAQTENDTDIVIAGYKTMLVRKNKSDKLIKTKSPTPVVIQGIAAVRCKFMDLFSNELIFAPWAKLYKTQIIKEHDVKFPEFRRSQDIVFNYRYYNYINTLLVISHSGYCYRKEYTAQIKQLNSTHVVRTISFIYDEIRALYKNWNMDIDMRELATSLSGFVMLLVENNCCKSHGLQSLLNDSVLQDIIHLSHPVSLPQKIFRLLFCKKNEFLLTVITYSKIWIKRILKTI